MSITLTCGCGKHLVVSESAAGSAIRCAACGSMVQIPAMGITSARRESRPHAGRPQPYANIQTKRAYWPWLAVGIAVLLLAGIGLFLLNRGPAKKSSAPFEDDPALARLDDPGDDDKLPGNEHGPKSPQLKEVPKPEPPKEKPLVVELPAKETPREKPRETTKPALPQRQPTETPTTPKETPKPPPPPTIEIDRVEPAVLKMGGSLTVTLTGKDGSGQDADIEYRNRGEEAWKKADKGTVKLTDLSGTALALEFRAVDGWGKPSPVLAKTWKIEQAKLVGQTLQLEWKLKPGDRFFQELRVVQKPAYNIQGIPFTTVLEYAVVSSFKVDKAGPAGYEIQQKVEGAQLVQADPLTQPLLAPAVLKLPGTSFTISLDDKMDIKKFEAAGLPAAVTAQGALGLQVASLLDQDGWKEMARTTFFQPNRPLKPGAKWSQPMTHSWGALGSWAGRIHYAYAGGKGSLHQFAFGLDINYQAPKGKSGLGMLAISGAAFKAQQAGGSIIFDADKGKVTEARERFLVRGRLALQLLGQNTPVDLEEDQMFHVRIMDGNPLKKE